jgi:hypothetical protein
LTANLGVIDVAQEEIPRPARQRPGFTWSSQAKTRSGRQTRTTKQPWAALGWAGPGRNRLVARDRFTHLHPIGGVRASPLSNAWAGGPWSSSISGSRRRAGTVTASAEATVMVGEALKAQAPACATAQRAKGSSGPLRCGSKCSQSASQRWRSSEQSVPARRAAGSRRDREDHRDASRPPHSM